MVRILLAMPHGLLRGALKYVLSTHPDMDVIAERDAVETTIAAVRADQPDVTVLDLELLNGAGKDPAGAARAAHSELPDSKILVLVDPRRPGVGNGMSTVPPTIGFLAQTASPERVVEAVLQLAAGEPVVDSDLVMAALTAKMPLTVRELRVLEEAALGTPVKEIARTLALSPGTVRNHLSRIIAKTGARNRIEAIHFAKEKGWI